MGPATSGSKFRAPPAAVRNVSGFSSQNQGQQRDGSTASSALAFADRTALAPPEQQRARNNASECAHQRMDPLQAPPYPLSGSSGLPTLQKHSSQVDAMGGTQNISNRVQVQS